MINMLSNVVENRRLIFAGILRNEHYNGGLLENQMWCHPFAPLTEGGGSTRLFLIRELLTYSVF